MSITSSARAPPTRRAPRRRGSPSGPPVDVGTSAAATPGRRPRTRIGNGGTSVAHPAASSPLAVSRPCSGSAIAVGSTAPEGLRRPCHPVTGVSGCAAPTRREVSPVSPAFKAEATATSATAVATPEVGGSGARAGARDGAPVTAPARVAVAIRGRPPPPSGRAAPPGRNGARCSLAAGADIAFGVGCSFVSATRRGSF